jgi:hypothetical protein
MKNPNKFRHYKLSLWFYFLTLLYNSATFGQVCESTIEFQLKNIDGGIFVNQKVTLTSRLDGTSFNQHSDVSGLVSFKVPCSTLYDVVISNYADKIEIQQK